MVVVAAALLLRLLVVMMMMMRRRRRRLVMVKKQPALLIVTRARRSTRMRRAWMATRGTTTRGAVRTPRQRQGSAFRHLTPSVRLLPRPPSVHLVTRLPCVHLVTRPPYVHLVTRPPCVRLVTRPPCFRLVTRPPCLRLVRRGSAADCWRSDPPQCRCPYSALPPGPRRASRPSPRTCRLASLTGSEWVWVWREREGGGGGGGGSPALEVMKPFSTPPVHLCVLRLSRRPPSPSLRPRPHSLL